MATSSAANTVLRATKPKLSLSVPTGLASAAGSSPRAGVSPATALRRAGAHTSAAPKSPFPLPISPSPISSPTARNTLLNQRGGLANPYTCQLLQQHERQQRANFSAAAAATATNNGAAVKSALKRGSVSAPGGAVSVGGPSVRRESTSSLRVKTIAFRDEPSVRTVSPMPEDYYGTYQQLSRDERRWVKLM